MGLIFHPCLPAVAAFFTSFLLAIAVLLPRPSYGLDSTESGQQPVSAPRLVTSTHHEHLHWTVSGGLVAGGPSIGLGAALRIPVGRFDLRMSILPGIARGYGVIDTYIDWGQLAQNGFIWGVGPAAETVFDAGVLQRLGAGGNVGWRRNRWLLESRIDLYLLHIGPTIGLWLSHEFAPHTGTSSTDKTPPL